MNPFEKTIKRNILKYINQQDYSEAHSVPQGDQQQGEPDIDGTVRGISLKIEVKQPGKKPTKLQQYKLDRYHACGAVVGVAYSVQDGVALHRQAVDLSELPWQERKPV